MINLLSSELYKLRKSKSFLVSGILSAVFVLFLYVFYALAVGGMLNMPGAEGEAILESVPNQGILEILRQTYANSNAIIFVTIFVCLFVLGDYSGGAIKNLVGKGARREEIFLAKFLVTEFGAVVLYLVAALTVLLGGIAFQGTEQLTGAFFESFLSYLSMQILYLTAYTAIITTVCEMTRNTAGILISILGIMLFSTILFEGIDLALSALGAHFGLSKFWITTLIAACPVTDIPARYITGSGVTAGVWLIAALTAGMLHFSRKDVG